MSGLLERLPQLRAMRREMQELLRANYADRTKNSRGVCSNSLIGNLAFLGTADFLLDGDVDRFRRQLSEAGRIKLEMLDLLDVGEPIDASYASALCYQDVFHSVSSLDFETASAIAGRIAARQDRDRLHRFDEAFGEVVFAIVLDERDGLDAKLSAFESVCTKKLEDFRGYAAFFRAMLAADLQSANTAVTQIATGHERQSKRGILQGTTHEVLCVWGLGACNLARHRGITVEAVPPLIPAELLGPCSA